MTLTILAHTQHLKTSNKLSNLHTPINLNNIILLLILFLYILWTDYNIVFL